MYPACNYNTSDFARGTLNVTDSTSNSIESENETVIGDGNLAYLMEESSYGSGILHFWTIKNGIGYYIFSIGQTAVYSSHLPEIRGMIDSIAFVQPASITKRSVTLDYK